MLPLRQAGRPDPGNFFSLAAGAIIIYIFAGFFVYWQKTGSWTIGTGGHMTDLGALIWLGPLVVWMGVYLVGPRGPFTRLWYPPARMNVDRDGIEWNVDGQTGRVTWSDVREVGDRMSSREATNCSIKNLDGRTLARVPARVVGPSGVRQSLVNLVIEARPDLFERVGSQWKAAVRRGGTSGP